MSSDRTGTQPNPRGSAEERVDPLGEQSGVATEPGVSTAGEQDLSRATCATKAPKTVAGTERAYKIVTAHVRPAALEFSKVVPEANGSVPWLFAIILFQSSVLTMSLSSTQGSLRNSVASGGSRLLSHTVKIGSGSALAR